MNTKTTKDKVSFKDILSPLDRLRESEPMPAHSQIEMELIDTILKLNALDKRQREIDKMIREEPMQFFRNLVYEIEYEKINDKKIKLVKYAEGLSKRIPENSRQAIGLHSIAAPTTISRGKHGVKYVPLSILNEHKKVRDELTDIQNRLEKLYEQKSIIYQEINNSPTGIANSKTKALLNELDMIESSLSSREADLEKDVFSGTISTRRSIPEQVTNIAYALEELSNIRNKEPEEKREIEEDITEEPETELGLTKEEEEELNEMEDIRRQEDEKEMEDEMER